MNEQSHDTRGYGFVAGLVTGACVGVGLALWLAPRAASELRGRAASSAKDLRARAVASAKDLGDQVSGHLEQASVAVGDARDELLKRGRSVRDDVADAVANGAGEVERFAIAAKSDGHAARRSS